LGHFAPFWAFFWPQAQSFFSKIGAKKKWKKDHFFRFLTLFWPKSDFFADLK